MASAVDEFEHYQRLQDQAIAQSAPYPAGRFSGRGIVICAGGARMFTCAWVAINVLRRLLGCTLPIQVWHLGPAEMGPPMRALLEARGIEVVDAHIVRRRHPAAALGGWELKPYAIIHSRFREVLLLDADNVPVVDPAFLFETPQFRETGAIFWPDIVRIAPENSIWKICRVPFRDVPAVESGQIVLDKERCWAALALTMHLNENSDFYYRHVYGDKDTFLMAWLMRQQPYAMTSHQPKRLPGTLCQHDFDGRLLFQHRNAAKWVLLGKNLEVPRFRHEEACRGFIAELQRLWAGRVFNPPPRSAAALALESELSGRRFRYVLLSSGEMEIELLSGNRIGIGRSAAEQVWYVADGGDGPELVIGAEDKATARLSASADGTWRGHRLIVEQMPVELHPAAPARIRVAGVVGHNTDSPGLRDWSEWKYRPIRSE